MKISPSHIDVETYWYDIVGGIAMRGLWYYYSGVYGGQAQVTTAHSDGNT